MAFIQELKKKDVILVNVPANVFKKRFIAAASELAAEFDKVCVASLEVPVAEIAAALGKAGNGKKGICLIGLSAPGKKACPPEGACAESDGTVMDLSMVLYRFIDTSQPKAVLVGPISVIGQRNDKMEALKFINYLADDARKSGRKLVLFRTEEERGQEGLRDVVLFVDKVLEEK